ncbi:hypothetical protein [Methyloversatilis sp. RAC08]|uniref:hypothetical protein n=1 Tax=Methyloversatilis sp. RAC08 TaxID=1842540 RepID=UPI00123742A7|nr:hypothetical protein [Methyloversatilis sp. RAC08]
METNTQSGTHTPTSHILVFLAGALLIGLWIYTRDLIASGIIAAAFGWYVATRIEEHFLAVTCATVLGIIFYAMKKF